MVNARAKGARDKKAKGIPRDYPWSKAKRTKVVSGDDDRGKWQRTKKVSRQAELARLGCIFLREKDKDALHSSNQYMADGQKSLNNASSVRGLSKITLGDYGDAVAGLEDWILYAMPDDSPDRLRLVEMDELLTKAWEAEAKGESVPDMTNKFFCKPMSKQIVTSYCNALSSKSTEKFQVLASKFKDEPEYCGREVTFPTTSKIITYQRQLDNIIAGETGLADPDVLIYSRIKSGEYHPQQAVRYNVDEALPKLRDAMLNDFYDNKPNDIKIGLKRVQAWTMLLWSQVCFARASLFTKFCPNLSQLECGPLKGDIPAWYKLTLHEWKHNPGNDTQQLIIVPNKLNPAYCPVAAMYFWQLCLRARGVTDGPLFPQINARGEFAVRIREDGVKMMQKISCDSWEKTFKGACKLVGGDIEDCTCHSIRRSSVLWAARCNAMEKDVLRAGRWTDSSPNFMTYWGEGRLITAQMLNTFEDEIDPIFKFWVFKATAHESVKPKSVTLNRVC